jgi:protein-tyrosine phosphatase
MIDIHCHLIPGVDDGSKSLEDSIKLIKKAVSIGITDIILTSHYGSQRGYIASHQELLDGYNKLVKEVKKQDILLNLYLGREIDATEDIEYLLKENKVETLNNTKYVLIDFGMEKSDIDEMCYNLVIAGYKPIIAHPERYRYSKTSDFAKWKETGALLQMNASSLFHNPSKEVNKKAKYLLKHNLIDILASDTHRWEHSYIELEKVTNLIQKKYKSINLNKVVTKIITKRGNKDDV